MSVSLEMIKRKLAEVLPVRAQHGDLTIHLQCVDCFVDENGDAVVRLQPLTFNADGAIADVWENEQVLIPAISETNGDLALSYVEAWAQACRLAIDQEGRDAASTFLYPLYSLSEDQAAEHPLRRGILAVELVAAIVELRAEQRRIVEQAEGEWADDVRRVSEVLEATRIDFVRLLIHDAPPRITGSRLGGLPYLPPGAAAPRDGTGRTLRLAAQLALSELPALPGFPSTGILQWFVSDAPGRGAFGGGDGVALRYYREIVRDDRPASLLELGEPSPGMANAVYALRGELASAPMSYRDYRFADRLRAAGLDVERWTDPAGPLRDFELGVAALAAGGHKLGGYPHFTSGDDPRGRERDRDQGYELLLQLDTDEQLAMRWGRSQTAHVFLRAMDLAAGDVGDPLFGLG
jgi:uncharacterized protein YwqG